MIIKLFSFLAMAIILALTNNKPEDKQDDKMITVKMPARYWGITVQGLSELPAKIANPVIDSITVQYMRQINQK